ncbi:MAG: radical SAM protein [Candidatus Aminicenantes bacterium]|nr:radical SAM protein [Candidatus Aminicenantes bacterium]
MKILLLNPPYAFKVVREGRCQHEAAIWDSVYPPLSLATIASYLRDDHEVRIVDAIAEEMDGSSLIREIEADKTDLVIASVSTPTIKDDLDILKKLKSLSPAKIAIFGVHATYFAEDLIREDCIDYVILNDPEIPAAQIASGKKGNLEGVVTEIDGEIISVPPPAKKISSFRIPSWDLVDLTKYKIPIKRKSYVLVSTARGCPYDCSFCVVPYYYGKRIRYREVDEIIEELKAVSKFVDNVFFHTDLFTFKKDYVLSLCERICQESLGIEWICNSRVDTFDREMADAMKKAGCWMVSFGVESGNQEILDLCGKRITLEQSKKAIQISHEAGLISIGHFVLGFPGESGDTLRQTVRFSSAIDPDFAEFYIATPFPGSRLFENVKKKIELDWNDIRYDHDPYDTNFDLEKIRKSAYFRFYLRPKKIMRFIRLFGLGKIFAMGTSAIRFLRSFLKHS